MDNIGKNKLVEAGAKTGLSSVLQNLSIKNC